MFLVLAGPQSRCLRRPACVRVLPRLELCLSQWLLQPGASELAGFRCCVESTSVSAIVLSRMSSHEIRWVDGATFRGSARYEIQVEVGDRVPFSKKPHREAPIDRDENPPAAPRLSRRFPSRRHMRS